MQKSAKTQTSINSIIASQWSLRAFSKKAVEEDEIAALPEANKRSGNKLQEMVFRHAFRK